MAYITCHRFNGAAARMQRNESPTASRRAGRTGFNGAAARMQRNVEHGEHPVGPQPASMGPPHECSGMEAIIRDAGVRCVASMGPPHECSGMRVALAAQK